MGKIRYRFGLTLSVISLLLLLSALACYIFRWDSVAALTNFPIWATGLIGIAISAFAHFFLSAKLGLSTLLAWLIAILAIADEPRVLLNFSANAPVHERTESEDGKKTLRIITLNCRNQRDSLNIEDIAVFDPDIVFFQELVGTSQARHLQQKLFGTEGHLKALGSCAILSRYPLSKPEQVPGLRSIIAKTTLTDGTTINLINLHLSSSTSRMDLWNAEAWQDHRQIRQRHREEVDATLKYLARIELNIKTTPTLLGGDLNSTAGDPALEALKSNFTDAFGAAGKGWSNTYPSHFPLLRLDYIFSTESLECEGAIAVAIEGTDHRMIVADFTGKYPF